MICSECPWIQLCKQRRLRIPVNGIYVNWKDFRLAGRNLFVFFLDWVEFFKLWQNNRLDTHRK